MRRLRLAALLLLHLCAAPTMAETVYVNDQLRLGVRSAPSSGEAPIEVVTSGMTLEVLERSGHYLKVRTGKGTEGWVNGGYTVSEPPARVRIVGVEEESSRLKAALEMLKSDTDDLKKENKVLSARINELLRSNSELEEELSGYRDSAEGTGRYVYPAFLVGLFLLGIILGIRWHKGRVEERFGGMEV